MLEVSLETYGGFMTATSLLAEACWSSSLTVERASGVGWKTSLAGSYITTDERRRPPDAVSDDSAMCATWIVLTCRTERTFQIVVQLYCLMLPQLLSNLLFHLGSNQFGQLRYDTVNVLLASDAS